VVVVTRTEHALVSAWTPGATRPVRVSTAAVAATELPPASVAARRATDSIAASSAPSAEAAARASSPPPPRRAAPAAATTVVAEAAAVVTEAAAVVPSKRVPTKPYITIHWSTCFTSLLPHPVSLMWRNIAFPEGNFLEQPAHTLTIGCEHVIVDAI
jgi:hypothetical protein